MATFKNWSYPRTKEVEQFDSIFDSLGHAPVINRWYKTYNSNIFVYINSKFYYHLVMVVEYKNSTKIGIQDYICERNGKLKHSKHLGTFSSIEEAMEFIKEKVGV